MSSGLTSSCPSSPAPAGQWAIPRYPGPNPNPYPNPNPNPNPNPDPNPNPSPNLNPRPTPSPNPAQPYPQVLFFTAMLSATALITAAFYADSAKQQLGSADQALGLGLG